MKIKNKKQSKIKKSKLPEFLRPYLWSVKIEDLDLEKDKIYIIHQILAFGNLKALKWLFETYSLKEIKKIFLNHPLKIYREPTFLFVKEILLEIKEKKDIKKYVSEKITI
ncbi:hypothetical protein J7J41_02185 [bacterium]|nr:hypothetical protein [bacterium]